MGGSSAPDTSGQNEAAKEMAEIAKEQWGNYKDTYLPLERQYAADAQNYDTAGNRALKAGQANADVEQGFADQRGQQARQLEQYGISPDSGKFAVVNARLRGAQAAAQAGAQNNARQQVENTGWSRRTDALSLGKGLPAGAEAGLAGSAGIYGQINNQNIAANNQQAGQIGAGISGGLQAANFAQKQGWFSGAGGGADFSPISTTQQLNPSAWGGYKRGGLVHFRDGGRVSLKELHLSYGGPADALAMAGSAARTAPPAGPSGPSPMQTGIGYAQDAKTAYNLGNRISNLASGPAPGTADTVAGSTTPGTADIIGSSGVAGDVAGSGEAGIAAGASEAAADAAAATTAASTAAATGGIAATAAEAAPLALMLLANGGRADGTSGGDVSGPGTSTSDSIPAMLSDGEFVLNKESVDHFGLDKLKKMNEVGLKIRHGIKG
jgi:hypothetical protein